MNSDSTIGRLLRQARSSEQCGSDLGALLEVFRPSLMELADARLGEKMRRRMSQSDLVQETMLTATEHFSAFRGQSGAEFRNWLMEVFRTRLIDGIRRHRLAERRSLQREKIMTGDQLEDRSPSPSQCVALEEEANAILSALAQLPDQFKEIVRMRYIDDLTFEEIAILQRSSVTTIWRRWSDAVQLLKQHLESGSS